MAQKNFGTFTKGDDTRVAASQAAAVRMRFDGWKQTKDATPAAQAELEAKADTPAAQAELEAKADTAKTPAK